MVVIGDGGWVHESDEVSEVFGFTVMGCCGGEDECFCAFGEACRELGVEGGVSGDVVAFIYDDDIPLALLDVVPVPAIVFEGVDGHDDFVVVMEWVFVEG